MADAAKTKTDAKTKVDLEGSGQAAAGLAPAGQAGDPAVQQLLAEREIHRLNAGDEHPEAQQQRDDAHKAIAAIDKKLNELGYNAS